jgi:putative membrane protein
MNQLLAILLQAAQSAPIYERGVLGTLVFSAIGLVMSIVAYKIIDLLIPGHMSKQIAEDKNLAVGVVAAAMILGICIIIAASIAS